MWIVFIYKCEQNRPKILLTKKGNSYSPVVLKAAAGNFKGVESKFTRQTGIKRDNCYPERFFESTHSFSINNEEIWTTSVRLRDKASPKMARTEWFQKKKVFSIFRVGTLFGDAFRKEFQADGYWECLDTSQQ